MLGLPESMDLSREQIEMAALERSALLHPDAGGGDEEAEAALAEVNDARATLANPESRAGALLEVLGGPAASADGSLPEGFLAKMMGIREEVEGAIASKDETELARWRAWAIGRRKEHAGRVSDLLRGGTDRAVLKAVRLELNAWRYVERMIEQVGGS